MTHTKYSFFSLETNKDKEVIEKAVAKALTPYVDRLNKNLSRITDIVNIWHSLKTSEDVSFRDNADEILRLSIVFLHAALEDFFRTLAANLLPEADEQKLNTIPLVGLNSSGRAEKFFLGKLVQFKGKTVDEVIKTSIVKHLEYSNFNTIDDITRLLETLNLDISKVKHLFPKIEELMKRRHLIVHRADIKESIDVDKQEFLEVNRRDVGEWVEVVWQFFKSILPSTIAKHLIQKGYGVKIESDGTTLKIDIPEK